MAKILIPVNPKDSMDLNQDGKTTVGELAISALLILASLVSLLGALVVGGWVLAVERLPPWRAFGVILILSVVLTAIAMLWRMTRYERQEREARRQAEFERRRKEWEFDQARGISKEAGATTMSQVQIDAAAQQILARYYAGKGWTREACEKDGVMSAELWNEANAILKKRRIRDGRKMKLRPETFDKAWGMYCKAKLEANQYRIANDDWREAK